MKIKLSSTLLYILFSILFLVSVGVALVWLQSLFHGETLIDPGNPRSTEFVRVFGVLFNRSSPILLLVSCLPMTVIVITTKAFRFDLKPMFKRAVFLYIGAAAIVAITQFVLLLV